MPSNEPSDRPLEKNTTEGKGQRKKVVRVKRKSSSRHVADDDALSQMRDASTRESTPIKRNPSMPVPELSRRTDSPHASRTSLPYPSFSKEHSRESVGSKENIATTERKNLFTPDPTDLDERKENDAGNTDKQRGSTPTVHINAPLSPPLTATEASAENRASPSRSKRSAAGRTSARTFSNAGMRRGSPLNDFKLQESSNRRSSARTVPIPESILSIPKKSGSQDNLASTPSIIAFTTASSTADSESTDATPKQEPRAQSTGLQPTVDADHDGSSPETGSDISIRTPTPRGTPAPPEYKRYEDNAYPTIQPSGVYASPIPPPPPPPPIASLHVPRVDYLMQNGGLRQAIPKRFINAPEPGSNSPWAIGELPNPTDMTRRVQAFFAPFRDLLDGYTKVVDKTGSIAVATGYRSIARRLLDRLEAVFARDISSEICACIMCDVPDNFTLDDKRGVSWGEILEYVSGRRDLPQWPPFVLSQESVAAESLHEALKSPCQTLDVDVPDEYREHYIRQSKKTKESVDRWLSNHNVGTTTAPEEADDDTLTFAILTHLDPQLRNIFKDLLGITSLRPESIHPASDSRSQTPLNSGKTEIVEKSTIAIQRLYRLMSKPRAPEVATFLVNNQYLHNVLATLAAISDAEWEILTSGRFDGFLRSGAEDVPSLQVSSGAISRGSATMSPPYLASSGAPVAIDEETEIAVLAEVEREIFTGMEALEDAFEHLHTSAEAVRRILRERGAGLAMAAQMRRGSSASVLEARLGTPASVRGDEADGDNWLDDNLSEIAPDDSASMISKNRIRRKRRDERRTPAPIEESLHENGKHDFMTGGGTSRNSYRRRY